MNLFAPDYYKNFKCIADKCRHSCCIGWEIDIDNETLSCYNQMPGELGIKLRNIISTEAVPHFILDSDERCPFLTGNNLCEIILLSGEDKLCQICSDHPRFRNFFDSRTEIGLGLCCEAAGKLILSQKNKLKIVKLTDDNICEVQNEKVFFDFRNQIIEMLQNRSIPILDRIENMLKTYNIKIPNINWKQIFLSLEQLDNSWTDKLNELNENISLFSHSEFEIPFEQLIIYFIYRHLGEAFEDGLIKERIAFAALSFYIINALCQIHYTNNNSLTLDDLIEISRLYSSEIEYSQENVDTLLELLAQKMQP